MILSRACEYAVQAVLFLNSRPGRSFVSVKEIASQTRAPVPFLAKILGRLAERRLLTSRKGPGGGVRLARPASSMQILEVIEAVDGLEAFRRCVMGFARCQDSTPCPLHSAWKPLREGIRTMFTGRTLGNLSPEYVARRSRPLPGKRFRRGGKRP